MDIGKKLVYYVIALVAIFFGLIPSLVGIFKNWLWFDALGYLSVYKTILWTKVELGLVVFLASLALFYANILYIRRKENVEPVLKLLFTGFAVLLAFMLGSYAANSWEIILRFFNATNFGQLDPVFNLDIGFYVFAYPFYMFLLKLCLGLVLGMLVISGGYYLSTSMKKKENDVILISDVDLGESGNKHIHILGALLFFVIAGFVYFKKYSILFSSVGVVFGATYTDIFARLPGIYILTVVALGAGFVTISHLFWKRKLFVKSLVGLLLVGVLFMVVVPVVVQSVIVAPNEIEKEAPYIQNNIVSTLQAYGLDKVEEKVFKVDDVFNAELVEENRVTLDNARIWDWRPTLTTYKQIQELRLYYEFADVDIDRYVIEGKLRETLLSPREMNSDNLPYQSRTWVNKHLVYTHGYGVALSPVNEVTDDGLPSLMIKDIPPVSESFDLERPEIYYGELTNDYVVVNTEANELDYPYGDENIYTEYEGEGGVKIREFGNRLILFFAFGDGQLLFSKYLDKDSRIMYHRNIGERTSKIAPFLKYDTDPYMVVNKGKLYWIQDAYTTTDLYPYSDPSGRINYIRNTVKIVIDPYEGDVTYYIVEEDPILKTYMNIFPELFKPMSDMDPELREHLRYPEDLFSMQVGKYLRYHMGDTQVFYNQEDLWNIPNELYADNTIKMEPYFIIARLPGETKEKFMMIMPFTPKGKNNMIAWMSAISDQDDYGRIVLYKFPKESLVYGPSQVEARIDQDTKISEQLTLWSQRGSRVIRGNLLVLPIGDTVVFIEPVYLIAEQGQIPELKRVIVVQGNKVAMGMNLDEALGMVLGEEVVETISGEDESAEGTVAELYRKAKEKLQVGDLSGFEKAWEELGSLIETE